MDPRGVPVSTLTVNGPSLTGEATIKKGPALQSIVQELSEEVQKEPLPIEHREHIWRFQELLRGEPEK